jgi:hypothetical protein
MGNDNRDTQSGISFRDVADLLRQLGKEHGGRFHCELHLPMRSNTGVALDVRVVIKRSAGGTAQWVDCGGVSGRWPSGGSSTFAGLLFRLAHELDAKLEEERREAERVAAGQRRLL